MLGMAKREKGWTKEVKKRQRWVKKKVNLDFERERERERERECYYNFNGES